MANQEQLNILKQGIAVWNKWREKNSNVVVDLSDADLRGIDFAGLFYDDNPFHHIKANLRGGIFIRAQLRRADLRGADLSEANLSFANLEEAYLNGALLTRADLRGAYLFETKLRYADLGKANLEGANLYGADLSGARLIGADLTNVQFNSAILFGTDLSKSKLLNTQIGNTLFAFADLTKARDIENVNHISRSTVDMDTIYRSEGKIPEVFLRGCGLSDLDIEYSKLANLGLSPDQVTDITYRIHQLYLGGGIQYYSCFISYSTKDQKFVQRLHNDLQDNGVRCWFAPEDMKTGDKIRNRIDNAIQVHDKLLIILSENSIESSWVEKEVETAFEKERKDDRTVLFPIRLDDVAMNSDKAWAADIRRTRHIGDFSKWKRKDSYQKAFERLLKDLKSTGS